MTELSLILACALAVYYYRTSAHLRQKLTAIEQCHSEAVGACVALTEELDELTARLKSRDEELAAFYLEEERRVERENLGAFALSGHGFQRVIMRRMMRWLGELAARAPSEISSASIQIRKR